MEMGGKVFLKWMHCYTSLKGDLKSLLHKIYNHDDQ